MADLPLNLPEDRAQRGSGVSRRALIQGGLALGLWSLAGCKGPRPAVADALPGPVEGGLTPPMPAPIAPPPAPVATPTYSGVIMPRSAWTSTVGPARRNVKPMNGVRRITVHHEGSTVFTAQDERVVAARIESIRNAHLGRRTKGEPWADIGYHYVIDPQGRIWEARSTQYQGAHAEDENEHNIGVMVLGNFERQQPTPAALATLDRFVVEQMRRYNVPITRVFTHQELGRTSCPGRGLQGHMLAARGPGGMIRVGRA